MKPKVKVIRKATPVRNFLLAVSLTCNVFLFTMAYAVVTGKVTNAGQAQEVALYGEDYATTLARN